MLVVLLLAFGWTAGPSAAGAGENTEQVDANSYWSFVDSTGCIFSDIGVSVTRGDAYFSFYVYRAHTPGFEQCPEEGLSLVGAQGNTEGGEFSFAVPNPSLKTATLEATIPVTCFGPSCPSETLDVHVSVVWEGTGGLVKSSDDEGNRYHYRYGTATGQVLFGGTDLLADLGPSDPTETNLVAKAPPS